MQAYDGPQYQLNSQVPMRFAEAIEAGKLPIVPNIVVGGGNGEKNVSGGLVEMLLTMMVAEKSGTRPNGGLGAER